MTYDSVMCVGGRHEEIALKAINSLQLFSECDRIFIITTSVNFPFFERCLPEQHSLRLLDEDRIASGLNLNVVKEILYQRIGSADRAGWYFQQFLKMSMSHHPEIADHYLIWDSDTVLLKGIDFFSDNKVLVNPKEECHPPYFKTIKKLLDLERQVDFSFISEHLMVKSAYMRELIAELSAAADSAGRSSWFEHVLTNVDERDLNGSGFSEFETYGNFIASRYPESFACRPLKSLRLGSCYFGRNPNRYDLARLMRLGNAFVSFEASPAGNRGRIIKNKTLSVIRGLFYRRTETGRNQLRLAGKIRGVD